MPVIYLYGGHSGALTLARFGVWGGEEGKQVAAEGGGAYDILTPSSGRMLSYTR